jgi:DNA-binding MarR family transcriptional regulator
MPRHRGPRDLPGAWHGSEAYVSRQSGGKRAGKRPENRPVLSPARRILHSSLTVHLDRMIDLRRIIHVTRIVPGAAAPEATTTPDELTDQIVADFRVTIGTMKCAMSERLVRLGISMAQLSIMSTLQRNGVMTMSHLADVLGVSLSNATGLVDRMEERGFIERSRVPEDRRVVLVRVTEAGTRLIQESDALSDELMRNVLARVDPAGLSAIAHAVAEVRSALETTAGLPARNLRETTALTQRSP